MSAPSIERDNTIYQEMLSHTALFSHPHPQKIAIITNHTNGVVNEVLKHQTVSEVHVITNDKSETHADPRAHCHISSASEWLNTTTKDHFDIIIVTDDTSAELFASYFKVLNKDGIFIQISDSPFNVLKLKTEKSNLLLAGFRDAQTAQFPQPNFPTGWRAALMAKKHGVFRKIREKDIFNRPFATHYYNFDIHKAALVLPEFMREELTT